MNNITVVYLAREHEQLFPFFKSYRKHPAGIEHELLVVQKCSHNLGRSLHTYYKIAKKLHTEYVCFLNSYSIIQCDYWLEKLYHIINNNIKIGMVGCSGSWESFRTNKPSIFNKFLIPEFPNPHLRTNAFLIKRKLMLMIWPKFILSKHLEYLHECGNNSLTRKLFNMNLDVTVIGANGKSYDSNIWPESNTYRSGIQSNLIVSDNRTQEYLNSDTQTKNYLKQLAWGCAA